MRVRNSATRSAALVMLLSGAAGGCAMVGSLFEGNECGDPLPYRSSIHLAPDAEDEGDALTRLARISADSARASALARVAGMVGEVELENECGDLVYELGVESADGEWEVIIDAGDGRVLLVEGGDEA